MTVTLLILWGYVSFSPILLRYTTALYFPTLLHLVLLCTVFPFTSSIHFRPALLIISPEGKVIAPNARIGVLEAPENYPWPGCVDEEVIR